MDKEKQEIKQSNINRYFSELQFRINIYNKAKKETDMYFIQISL